MTTKYFKAITEDRIYFRASASRDYKSVYFLAGGYASFSRKPGGYPVVEIPRAEFKRLVALKNARLVDKGRNPAHAVPLDSWVAKDAVLA